MEQIQKKVWKFLKKNKNEKITISGSMDEAAQIAVKAGQ